MHPLSSGLIGGLLGISFMGLYLAGMDAPRVAIVDHSINIGETVNRSAKSDRIVQPALGYSSEAWKKEFNAEIRRRIMNGGVKKERDEGQPSAEMPVGCEPAVSVVLDNILAKTPSRCVSSLPLNNLGLG